MRKFMDTIRCCEVSDEKSEFIWADWGIFSNGFWLSNTRVEQVYRNHGSGDLDILWNAACSDMFPAYINIDYLFKDY